MKPRTQKHAYMLANAGKIIRTARESAGVSQQTVADVFDWNRDAMSKVESGQTDISLYSFLTICDFLRDFMPPDHPATQLYALLAPGRTLPRRAPAG